MVDPSFPSLQLAASPGDNEALDAVESGLPSTGNSVLDEARRRFQRCAEWEAAWRPLFVSDIKFRHGDADNGFQWPNSIRRSRDVSARPCLTMNLIRQHNLQIINDGKKNKVEVRVIGTGGGATAESAELFQDIAGHIQYQSAAQSAYSVAREFQVDGGIGYWRLVTDYAGPDTFDQEIFILPIRDPLTIYLDPDIRQRDGSDANFGFLFDRVPKDQFREAYPKFAHLASLTPLGVASGESDWIDKNNVMVCEYFRKVLFEDQLLSFVDPTDGRRKSVLKSQLAPTIYSAVKDSSSCKSRSVWSPVVEWKLFVGEECIDETVWPGQYIPIVRCIGEETIINGVLDRKGHTRAMKDPQRMLNYNASAQVEFVALQGKTPWTGAAAAIEDHESIWNTANNENHAYLPFNHKDDSGDELPVQALPRRQEPPSAAPAFEAGMQTAFNQMMMVSGQWQNAMGMAGNERTGAAIDKRLDQGDTATFHFDDNFQSSIVFTGKQLIDLIPKIYDTERMLRIQASDGSEMEISIDPKMRQAAIVKRDEQQKVVARALNPTVGKYEVRAAPGAAKGSKREQTVEALTLILTQAPALTGVIGDILMAAMDFPQAQEAAQRLRRMVPPQALGQGPTQQEAQLQQQVHQLQLALSEALKKLGKEQLKLTGKAEMRDIDVYKAETDRFKALADAGAALDPEGIRQAVEDLIREAAQTHLGPILEANAQDIQTPGEEGTETKTAGALTPSPPVPGARQAPDGEWYLTDPTRKGKFLRVAPLAQEHSRPGVIANV